MIVCVKDRPELIPEVAKVDCEAFGTMECYNLTVTSLKNRSDKFYAMVRHNKVIGVVGYDFSYQNCTVEGHEDVPFISDVCIDDKYRGNAFLKFLAYSCIVGSIFSLSILSVARDVPLNTLPPSAYILCKYDFSILIPFRYEVLYIP